MESRDKIDIQKWGKRLESAERDLRDSDISRRNKKLILDFVRFKRNAHRIGEARQTKYVQNLNVLAEKLGKDFDKATIGDLEDLVEEIYSMNFTEWTKRIYLQILKAFYKWLKKEREPEETAWIEVPSPKPRKVRPDEIITWEDAVRLSRSAMNPRDKALPQVLWESGCRISELLTLHFNDIEKVNGGEALILHLRQSKTEVREVVISDSAPALTEWMEAHPKKKGLIWVNLKENNDIMTDSMARRVLERLGGRSGLKKPLNPHNFRKSSATILASNENFSEQEIKKRYGWDPSSKMLNIYVHLDDKRVTKKYLQQKGILPPEDQEVKKDAPIKCRWCNIINAVGRETCRLCKRPLHPEDIRIKDALDRRIDELANVFLEKKMEEFKEFVKFGMM